MRIRIFSIVALAFVLVFGINSHMAFAMHHGPKKCPMQHEKKCCDGKRGQCPFEAKRVHSFEDMDRTAGGVPVYKGTKQGCQGCPCACCKKAKAHKSKCAHKPKKAATGHDHESHKGHSMSKATVHDGPEAHALDEAMVKMHREMALPYTGDADADFIRGMIPHHQGAVDMANIVLKYGDDEQAKKLARNIIRAQKSEIAWMKRWLEQRQIPQTGEFRFNR